MVKCKDCQHCKLSDNFPGFCVGYYCTLMSEMKLLRICDERECKNFLKIEKKKGLLEKLKHFMGWEK